MAIDRRGFLVRTGLMLSAGALGVPLLPQPADARGRARGPDLSNWSVVRAQFRLSRDYVHMAGFLFASHPKPVREAIERYRLALDENPVHYLYENRWDLEAKVLTAASSYLGVEPTEIALTDSTTMGLGLLYTGLRLGEGQEAITTVHDHYSTRESLRLKGARSRAAVREISLYKRLDAVSADEIVDSVRQAVTPKTRVVALTWVHSNTGLKLPIRRIADMLAEINGRRDEGDRVLLCVDGVHALGVEDVSLPELGCDFFIAGTHKWLFGPRGTGLVWGRPRAWASATPTIPTFTGTGDPGATMTPGGFHSFEHRWAVAEAFDFHTRIGRPRVAARIHELNRMLKEGLAAMEHVTLYTPLSEDLSAGLVCFEVKGLSSDEVIERLKAKKIIGSVSPYAGHYARLSPCLLNSPAQVERTLRAVRSLAAPA